MNLFFYGLACLSLLAASAQAQPVIGQGGVLNNSSNALDGSPNAGIAQGSIFVVYGTGLGPAALQQTGFPLPVTLAGTSVKVTVNGTSVNALLIYTSATQVASLLPSSTPVGTGTITVTYNNQTSATAPIKVVSSAFGITTLSGTGAGQAVVQNFVSNTNPLPINTITTPAQPGQTLILYGTGLGPVTFDESKPASSGDVGGSNFQLYVGGQPATVTYKGRSSCCAGLDQINFIVPNTVDGCFVPVAASVNGVVSNFASIAVAAPGKSCSDPTGFSGADLSAVQTNGALRFGAVSVNRSTADTGTVDSASAVFFKYTTNQLLRSQSFAGNPAFGACRVTTLNPASSSTGDPFAPTGLDAGTQLVLSGPSVQRTLSPVLKGLYADTSTGANSLYLNPGTFTISNGAGGADVGSFSQSFTVSPPLVWTNKASIGAIDRSKPLTITWSGGDPNGYVEISGTSDLVDVTAGLFVATSFDCTERVTAGHFTIPAYVLQALPASPPGASLNSASLEVGSFSAISRFNAPGLDFGYVISGAITDTTAVQFQ